MSLNYTSSNYTQLLSADKAQVSSTTSASNVMSYDLGGNNNIVGVVTLATINPTTIILNSSLKSLKGLEGKTFGYYNSMSASYVAMFAKEHVPFDKVKLVKLTNRDPTIVTSVVQGLATFLGSQDLQLQQKGVPYTEITSQQLKIPGTTQIMMMNRTFLKDHAFAAENFIRANLEALNYCAVHAQKCVNYIVQLAASAGQGTTDTPQAEIAVRNYQYNLIREGGTKPVGTFTEAMWKPEYHQLQQYGAEANRLSGLGNEGVQLPTLGSMLNRKLVASVYNKQRQLLWP